MTPCRNLIGSAVAGVICLLCSVPVRFCSAEPFSTNANRLTYLDESNPFYPSLDFPKLTTPQWVGEPGVEAVVILSIDDMRETERYEKFLRPILERLKQIDGRAPVSIMVNAIAPTNAQLQTWLKEGVSLDVHTLAHPCPCLAKGDFTAAANTYHGCIELMNQIPGNKPVAFRMPCCDSMNSPSPRFYAEIFNRANSAGQFLTIDSSVMVIPTARDKSLPRELVLSPDGRERFWKYLPKETNANTRVSMGSFTTTIEDYPYPYVIGKSCWEFPAMVPSDWEAFNLHGSTNATTLADWKAALDIVVLKQGVFTFIFHPHGWSSPQQFVEFIDYAVTKHGRKVKFLTFREAQERLDKHLLAGHPLRDRSGMDNGVRLADINNDGYMDVLIGNVYMRGTRTWKPTTKAWDEQPLRTMFVSANSAGHSFTTGARLGILSADGTAAVFAGDEANNSDVDGPKPAGKPARAIVDGRDDGVRFRDVDNDGACELIVGNEKQNTVLAWSKTEKTWKKLPYALPRDTAIVDAEGRDAGLRFVDVNEDGYDDVLFSNEKEFSLHLFVPKANPRLMWEVGWNDRVFAGKRGESKLDIPMIVRGGTNRNNGVWFAHKTMWVQNEDTAHLPDKVDRRSFRQLLNADEPQAMSPKESLQAMRVRPGFKVELVAAEPLVTDPIAFEWGAEGRLWVVEMVDYPLGKNGDGKPGGQVKFLEDLDDDGRYDKATVFLEVGFPTGVMPWRNGVLVAAAPEIFYAEDTDGDGKADKRQTLFTGFVEGNQQHRLNGFDYGLDNWIYGANGDSGGQIKVGADVRRLPPTRNAKLETRNEDQNLTSATTKPVSISGRDFRFRPDSGEFEAIEGQTQFGRHRDDWGNWFGNNNPTWLWHYYSPERYLTRNTFLSVKSTKQLLANYPESTRLYPASRTRQRFNDHHQLNHVTSGNSAMPYRDDLFGPDFATSVFISDPVHNVVHREVLEPDGVTFTSHRAAGETITEFLASADNWFRPIMLKTGPDGALYIADMYRQVLEHPEWIPAHIRPRLDLRAGEDKGRIYRVYPENATLRKVPRLDRLDAAGLVAVLESSNGWQRDAVQRLLVQRGDKAVIEPLAKLFRESPNPKTRLQALCTLEGLDATAWETVVRAWRDPHPDVRAHGIRVAEPFRGEIERRLRTVRGLPELGKLVDDPSPRVRQQLAFSLGEWNGPECGFLLARLALRDFDQPQLRDAILSSATNHVVTLIESVLARHEQMPAELLERLLGLAASLRKDDAIAAALEKVAQPGRGGSFAGWQFAALDAFLDALDRRNMSLEQYSVTAPAAVRSVLPKLDAVFADARAVAGAREHQESERLGAIRVLGRLAVQRGADVTRLAELLRPENSAAMHQAAVASLVSLRENAAAEALLAGWKSHSPAMREDVLAGILSRPDWIQALLAKIESDVIPARQINAVWQQKLLKHRDTSIRERATKLFATAQSDRRALLKEYSEVAKLKGDAGKGLPLFRQHCAACHRLGGDGKAVGPDLGMMADKSVEALVTAILDPNQAVETRYVSYTAVTKDEREVSGLITAESANSITLRAADGREETLLRADLKELASSGLSLMPEGFEHALKPQDMADLLAVLVAK